MDTIRQAGSARSSGVTLSEDHFDRCQPKHTIAKKLRHHCVEKVINLMKPDSPASPRPQVSHPHFRRARQYDNLQEIVIISFSLSSEFPFLVGITIYNFFRLAWEM